MSLNTFTHQTIALAGITQAAALVEQLATTGTADPAAFKASIGSLLKIDSEISNFNVFNATFIIILKFKIRRLERKFRN